MQVGVIHRIHDPAGFQKAGQEAQGKPFPAGISLPVSAFSPDGKIGLCIWEGPSLAAVEEVAEALIGKFSNQEYHQVSLQPPM